MAKQTYPFPSTTDDSGGVHRETFTASANTPITIIAGAVFCNRCGAAIDAADGGYLFAHGKYTCLECVRKAIEWLNI